MPTTTALCALPCGDLKLALPASGTLAVFYGPIGSNGYALILGDTLSMVDPLKRCVVNGTADAHAWRTALASLADGAICTVYEREGVLTLETPEIAPQTPVQPAVTAIPQERRPAIRPLAFSSLAPTSPTYRVIDGLLTLAELYTHGGALVRHDAIRRSWDIRISDRSAYRVQVTPTATALTSYTKTADGWTALETLCLPALPLHEQFRLFMNRSISK